MGITCIIYAHPGNDGTDRLRQVAADRGWTVRAVYQDDPLSAIEQRSGYKAMRRMLDMGVVQALLVPSLVDLADTVDGLVSLMAKLVAVDVRLLVIDDKIDTGTPEGAAWLATVASLASFQKAVRKRNARAGQLRAKSAGVRFGRPPVFSRAEEGDAKLADLRAALAAGAGIRPTARRFGISPARVQAEKNAMNHNA